MFSDRIMCAGIHYNEGTCQGDSGGPLMLPIAGSDGNFAFYQLGIVAYAEGCARMHLPTVYTRVQRFMEWIEESIEEEIDSL